MTPPEVMVATRTISASPSTVFAVLADPTRHRDTEPSDWVRDAIDTAPITDVGQVFAINMYLDVVGGHYVMHNLVTEFDADRVIAWRPGQLDDSGDHDAGGWVWRYELASPNVAPMGGGVTEVTLTYDWSGASQAIRDEIGGLPPFGIDFLHASLLSLDKAVTQ